jgi:hypothetical protein
MLLRLGKIKRAALIRGTLKIGYVALRHREQVVDRIGKVG